MSSLTTTHLALTLVTTALLGLTACLPISVTAIPTKVSSSYQPDISRETDSPQPPVHTPTPGPTEPKVLVICMAQEPESLFLYGNASIASQNVLEAVYDGPFDIREYKFQPVILEQEPSLANGGARLEPLEVNSGDLIIDNLGELTNLGEGVIYRPSGCISQECAKTYSGSEPVSMDSLVVHFNLQPGIRWSDGVPLTANDSVFSFEVARDLDTFYQPNLIKLTQSYQAIDELTVEWKGLPGYQDPLYYMNFFSPLPRHSWTNLTPDEMIEEAASDQSIIGWGPYVIDQRVPGDHISLSKNPHYFRSGEGLPRFEALVYRFIPDRQGAIDALLAGECDILDQSFGLEQNLSQLLQLQEAGNLAIMIQASTGWEQISFGIVSLDPQRPNFLRQKEARRAVAMCIDRQKIADVLLSGYATVPDSYTLPSHPLFNPDVRHYDYDPQAASELLTSIGWMDHDEDSTTPRVAQGVSGVQDGTQFEITYLTTPDENRQRSSQIIQESLAGCGIRVNVMIQDWEELLAPGPEGPVFGRNFDMAQFGWTTSLLPPCFLYLSDEIPGPYPDYPKSWGGVNATGYSSPDFDLNCKAALSTLPESPDNRESHLTSQAIFAEELPSIPLYTHIYLAATRPDMCGVIADASSKNFLLNLEEIDYGKNCANP